jgi:hypothetical protein
MTDERKFRVWTEGSDTFVADESGGQYKLSGYGAMRDCLPDLDPRIDLTAPIYEQVQRLAAEDTARAASSDEPISSTAG